MSKERQKIPDYFGIISGFRQMLILMGLIISYYCLEWILGPIAGEIALLCVAFGFFFIFRKSKKWILKANKSVQGEGDQGRRIPLKILRWFRWFFLIVAIALLAGAIVYGYRHNFFLNSGL